jgi:hypothetical protein
MSSMNHPMLRMNKFRLHYRPAMTTKHRVRRPLHHGSLAARAPVVPLPRFAGAERKVLSFSRRTCARGLPTKATKLLPPKEIRGGGAPKRRNCPVGPRHALGCCHPNALRARPRVQRNALAFRRSTAVLARFYPDSASGRVSWNRRVQTGGPSPAPVQRAPRGPVIVPDERGPKAARERFARPRAGTAPTPHLRSHPECTLRRAG